MSSAAPILVFGATGNIASALVHQLHSRGVPVIATVRDTAKAQAKLPAGVQTVQVDFKDVASVKQAVHDSGAKRAYALLDVISQQSLDAMKTGGLTHLVYVSTSFVGLPTEATPITQWQTGTEAAVKASGLTYTILRAEVFMSNSIVWKYQYNKTGKVIQSHPDVPQLYVAFDDVAAVAATALTTNQYDNQAVTIQGPAPITDRQQAQTISRVLGRPIEVVEVSETEYAEKSGVPPPVVQSIHAVKRFRAEKGAEFQAKTDAVVTGTVTFEQFVVANKQQYIA